MAIYGIGALSLYANEPAELAAWYHNSLGFNFQEDPRDRSQYGELADKDSGQSVYVAILQAKSELSYGNRGVRVNYKVARFAEFISQLERRGVKIDSKRGTGKSLFAYLTDPEGNEIELWSGE